MECLSLLLDMLDDQWNHQPASTVLAKGNARRSSNYRGEYGGNAERLSMKLT